MSEKIKIIRTEQGKSSADLAEGLLLSRSHVVSIEDKESPTKYTPDTILKAKEYLGIVGAPLYDNERQGFKDSLYRWFDITKNRHMEEAERLRDELSVILKLPFEPELIVLFKLFECKFFELKGDIEASRDTLQSLWIDESNDEIHYYYCLAKGSMHFRDRDYENALKCYLKAIEIGRGGMKDDFALHINIVGCYERLGLPYHALSCLEEAQKLYTGDGTDVAGWLIDSSFAVNFTRTNKFKKAREHLERCHEKALNINNQEIIGVTMLNFGYLYRKSKDYSTALTYFDKALGHLEKGSRNHLEALYGKARCYIAQKAYKTAAEVITEGAELSEGNEHYSILFKGLTYLANTIKRWAVTNIYEDYISYFLKIQDRSRALEYSKILLERIEGNEKEFKVSLPRELFKIVFKVSEEIMGGDLTK